MPLVSVVGIAFGLAMDAFSVATVVSLTLGAVSRRQVFRIAFHFGLFQALMPIIGFMAARSAAGFVEAWGHWIAFGVLVYIGSRTVRHSLSPTAREDGSQVKDPTRGFSLVALSIATSIDALAVGVSFAALGVSVIGPALITGALTGVLSLIGMLLGARVGVRFSKVAELAGGLVLIAIGIEILAGHFLQ